MWWRWSNQTTWRRGEAVMKIEGMDSEEEGAVVAMNATTVLPGA
jgi:hypothetical protein